MSERDEMIAAWKKQTGEHWHEGKGITRELWAAAWQAARRTVSGQEAKPVCTHCNGTDVELLRLCHNSLCSAYAREESFYKGWEDDAAPIPATEPKEPK